MFGIPETAFSELHWYERIKLRIRASLDARKGRFKNNEFQDRTQKKGEVLLAVTSPFAIMEIRRYGGKRDQYLGGKRHLYWSINERLGKRPRWEKFPKMLRELDKKIGMLETDINIDIMRTDDMLDMLQRQREVHDDRKEEHMSQLCVNKADKLRGEFYDRNIAKYQSLKSLLHEKLSKLETAQAHLVAVRRRFMLRLAYYYYRASNRDNTLNHVEMSEEQLDMMGDMDVMDQYRDMTKAMIKKLEDIDRDISVLSSWRN